MQLSNGSENSVQLIKQFAVLWIIIIPSVPAVNGWPHSQATLIGFGTDSATATVMFMEIPLKFLVVM